MLNVRKRVDGIPIFDKLDRPLYHLNLNSEKQNFKKCVMVVDEINDVDGRYIELNDCLKEKYEKIDIYTTSPLSSNSYTIEDQYSIKSVLNWINKSVWNKKKKGKSIKIKKSKSRYNGPLNKEIPLIIRLFKSKNEYIEMNTIHCNIYTEENVSTYKENKLNNKSNKFIKSNEIKKKQNRKMFSASKPNLLCIPINPSKFSWLKKKENKGINSNMSIDDFQFQDSDVSSFLPIKANNIYEQNNRIVEKEYEIEQTNLLKGAQLTKENYKKRNITIEISNENNESIDEQTFIIQPQQSKKLKTKQTLQSLVIPINNSIKTHHMNTASNFSASTLVNDPFEGFKYQESTSTSYIPSPCYSTSSTLVSPVDNSLRAEVDPKFEINSCGYADFLNERLNEKVDLEDDENERKRFSLPATSTNYNTIKGRKRSYAFSLTTNELNLIYSKANQVILSELCNAVENKQKEQYQKEHSSNSSKRYESYENEKSFVKGHNRTQSRHRRSHAVCLTSGQITKFENNKGEIQQNKRRSRYNRESNGASLSSSYNKLNTNYNKNIPNQDTQLKRRSTSMIKYKNSNSSLNSYASSNGNSHSSNSGNIRTFSNNRLSRDIELLRAIKMKRSRSVPKLDHETSFSRNPTKSRYSMDVSAFKDNIGISVHSNSVNSCHQQSNIVYYSFGNKNENINNFSYNGYKNVNRTSSYSLFGDIINQTNIHYRWSKVFDNGSSCGSSTYYYTEEDGIHNNSNNNNNNDNDNNNNNNNNNNSLGNFKEELINCELDNKSSYSFKKETSVPFIQLFPPSSTINMI